MVSDVGGLICGVVKLSVVRFGGGWLFRLWLDISVVICDCSVCVF